jgi:hypothetical protein
MRSPDLCLALQVLATLFSLLIAEITLPPPPPRETNTPLTLLPNATNIQQSQISTKAVDQAFQTTAILHRRWVYTYHEQPNGYNLNRKKWGKCQKLKRGCKNRLSRCRRRCNRKSGAKYEKCWRKCGTRDINCKRKMERKGCGKVLWTRMKRN